MVIKSSLPLLVAAPQRIKAFVDLVGSVEGSERTRLIEERYGKDFWMYTSSKTLRTKCTCDECAPYLYPGSCERHAVDIRPALRGRPLRLGKRSNKYESLQLAHCVIDVMMRPWKQMTSDQRSAVERFRYKWETQWEQYLSADIKLKGPRTEEIWEEEWKAKKDGKRRPNKVRRETLVLRDIALLLNTILFSLPKESSLFTVISAEEFLYGLEWVEMPGAFGRSRARDLCLGLTHVHLNPRTTWDEGLSPKELAIRRLGTLVHELVHAFLQVFGCTSCKLGQINIDTNKGHGRAWQLITKAARETVWELLEVQLMDHNAKEAKLALEYSARHSLHDLESFGVLRDSTVVENNEETDSNSDTDSCDGADGSDTTVEDLDISALKI